MFHFQNVEQLWIFINRNFFAAARQLCESEPDLSKEMKLIFLHLDNRYNLVRFCTIIFTVKVEIAINTDLITVHYDAHYKHC
jgi:hypothetical protein